MLGTLTPSASGTATLTLNAAGVAVLQGWISNPSSNYGFMLTKSGSGLANFSSREDTTLTYRPKLVINYSTPATAYCPACVGYSYADSAHKHAVTGLSSGESYAYDANGNMITRTEGGKTYNQIFDPENRLQYVYDITSGSPGTLCWLPLSSGRI